MPEPGKFTVYGLQFTVRETKNRYANNLARVGKRLTNKLLEGRFRAYNCKP
jgi:hypothetical protein